MNAAENKFSLFALTADNSTTEEKSHLLTVEILKLILRLHFKHFCLHLTGSLKIRCSYFTSKALLYLHKNINLYWLPPHTTCVFATFFISMCDVEM